MKFDLNKFESFEQYLTTIRYKFINEFFNLCEKDKRVEGLTMGEIKEKFPDIRAAYDKVNEFDEAVEKFFGYKFSDKDYWYEYCEDK